jgi:hypothetical protein
VNREDLIKLCRYYKGEKENPYQEDKGMFWNIERCYIEMRLRENSLLADCGSEYMRQGLLEFEEFDGTPFLLKALLFNRYEYWLQGTPDEFKVFYKEQYLSLCTQSGIE